MKRRHGLLAALAVVAWPSQGEVADRAGNVASARSAKRADAEGSAGAALTHAALQFPLDHGSHDSARTEWWYITGSLDAPGGALYGFQVTFFRSRTGLDLGSVGAPDTSRFAARQLLFAHAALSDLSQGRLRHDQRIARAGFGIAEASTEDTRLVLRDWTLVRNGTEAASVYTAHVASDSAGFALDLRLGTTQPLLLQGDRGYSRKGPLDAQASRYYSQPQLKVSGTLHRDQADVAVTGTAWLDHEWSQSLMPPEAVGWDWIGMNLDDGSALTAFRLRSRTGDTLWSGGSFRRAGASVQAFEGLQAARFTAGRRWTSPASGTAYPVQWTVDTPAGRFEVRALLDAQELDSRGSTGSIYWEGLADLFDATSGRRIGRGYLEMTGYAAPLAL